MSVILLTGRGCLLGGGGYLVRGVPAPGCVSGLGGQGVSGRGVLAPGRSGPGGVPGGDPPDGYCCGRYASYWNAFLFCNFFAENRLKMKEFGPLGKGALPWRPFRIRQCFYSVKTNGGGSFTEFT